jgi:hypothetical protein
VSRRQKIGTRNASILASAEGAGGIGMKIVAGTFRKPVRSVVLSAERQLSRAICSVGRNFTAAGTTQAPTACFADSIRGSERAHDIREEIKWGPHSVTT